MISCCVTVSYGTFERLEPDEGKLSSPVLRGGGGSNAASLPDTGQYRDSYINLDYFNARWYDGSLGRFTSPDTLIPDTGNVLDWDRYSFVRGNAVKYADPTGRYVTCIGEEVKFTPPQPNDPVYKRQEIDEKILEEIALMVFAETSNGSYPPEMIELITWCFMNRFAQGISIYSGALGKLQKSLKDKGLYAATSRSQPELARELLDNYYLTDQTGPAYKQTLKMVKDIYSNKWLSGKSDPTHGATYFSMSTDLTRGGKQNFKTYQEMQQWLKNNFAHYQKENPGFTYVISRPFAWNKYGEQGILILGNDICAADSSCGLKFAKTAG